MSIAAVLADSPLAFYLLNEPSGATAYDISGNNRNGVHVNNPIRLNCAMSYNGTNQDTTYNHAALVLPLTAGTIEAWMWLNEIVPPQGRYANFRDNSAAFPGDDGWILYLNNGTTTSKIFYRIGATQYNTGIDASTVQTQKWTHFAITYDNVESRYYIAGQHVFTGGPPGPNAPKLPWHTAKNGTLSEWYTFRAARMALFNTKLSAARIAAHAADAPCQVAAALWVDVMGTGTGL